MESEQLTNEFRQSRDVYAAFTSSVESLLRNLISATGIEPFAYEGRTKTIASFDEKIQREDKAGKYSCLNDVTDLSGVRIICYLQEDCDAVSKIIEEEFSVDAVNSISKHDELDPDKFGYLSTHYVVSLNDARGGLKEFRAFSGLKVEIQIRTLLQHTWAAIDWKFRYKEEREAPKTLRRRLFRISALLEAADNEFSHVKTELDDLRISYATSVAAGELRISINSESMDSYLNDSLVVKSIINIAKESGITVIPATQDSAQGRLVSTATALGYKYIEDLDNVIRALTPEAKTYFEFLVDNIRIIRNKSSVTLLFPAVIRYLLLGFAPTGKRQLINRQHPPSAGYGEAMAAFDRQRRASES
jgi:putative GTP pyrophosphokinase